MADNDLKMLKTSVLVLTLIGLIQNGVGQVILGGQCNPNLPVMQNFNLSRYLNRWYLIESIPNPRQGGTCNQAIYTAGANANTMNIVNSQVLNQALASVSASATLDSSGTGRLTATFPSSNVRPYWVLATNYDSYALVYSCNNVNATARQVWSWKLSRSQTLSQADHTAINTAVNANPDLDNSMYYTVDHSPNACFYFPVAEPNKPVRFRGKCDQNIVPVQNFNLTEYVGKWNIIELYPHTFQSGSCNSAEYVLGVGGSISITHRQVNNQALQTSLGSAVPFGDGSGRLNFTFNSAGSTQSQETPYWILATDYTSYALVYSCVEYDEEYSQVWSWKLSRTTSLPSAAVTAINSAMANIRVLDQRYYQQMSHTPAACFYFPVPQSGVPVEFPGQCDENIPVAPNFSSSRFAGSWNEVEAYPDVFWQPGQCIRHQYSASGNTLAVQSTRVSNDFRVQYTGSLSIPSFGDTAKMSLSMIINGQSLLMPFWIIATDYDNYALAYSCVFSRPGFRNVFSWKLSRSTTLSNAAQTAINTASANIDVINKQYFRQVDQSASACAALPNFVPGQPVIIEGQCDPNVAVVQNFNATRYMGKWNLISSYHSQFQSGECNRAEYTLASDGSVNIVNSHVLNEARLQASGRGVLANSNVAKMVVTINNNAPVDYWVLDTDYDSYALVYSCRNENAQTKRVLAWKLSRSLSLSANANAAINNVMSKIRVLNEAYFVAADQSDKACFYYPQFDQLPGVINLPGKCDASIVGIPQFNMTAYLGRWFEIQRYPQASQMGHCNRASYARNGNNLDIHNSEVLNRQLRIQTGVGVPASNGVGRFDVTFNVNGQNRNALYYVLATDYNNYALVYSCQDQLDNTRNVWSWKLSRSTTLSAQANTAINNVISSTQGLNQAYYTTTNQSDGACFYNPTMDPNKPMLFRGSCPNLSGQANFNMSMYLGWWHHIGNYPTGQNVGSCLSSEYVQSGNQFEFIDTQVSGLVSNVVRGNVVAANNGKLTKTSNGTSQDVWVLATDYSSYSLVFTCEKYDDEYVKVWSSLQSKSRSLSAAAESAIANVIANNDYLQRNFYLSVNQSDEACFHYPAAGDRIILPGQCNMDLPTQANFDIDGFSGTWYQIERYPYPEVSLASTCIGTRYTVDKGSISVQNWEVLNDQLNTIEGSAVQNRSGVLDVELPVPGSPDSNSKARLYILATDYSNYTVALTCENIDAFRRVVVAFKMSRTRSLSPQSVTAINSIIAAREELDQRYFIQVAQNNDCEEPNSSYLIKSSVFVILVCYVINMLV